MSAKRDAWIGGILRGVSIAGALAVIILVPLGMRRLEAHRDEVREVASQWSGRLAAQKKWYLVVSEVHRGESGVDPRLYANVAFHGEDPRKGGDPFYKETVRWESGEWFEDAWANLVYDIGQRGRVLPDSSEPRDRARRFEKLQAQFGRSLYLPISVELVKPERAHVVPSALWSLRPTIRQE